MSEALVLAFDREARDYDHRFGGNPVARLFRRAVQERLAALFPPGSRVIDLGCGTGEDALFLAARGVRATGIDPSPRMIARARQKAAGLGAPQFVCLPAEDLDRLEGTWDGAFSDFGALNCADLAAVSEKLARVLRPGAPLLVNLLGPAPWPDRLRRLGGRPVPRRGAIAPRVQGVAVPVSYPTVEEIRIAFGPAFSWEGTWALGALVPEPARAGWTVGHPKMLGVLWAVEGAIRHWPVVREAGDHVVLEGRRC